MTPPKHTSIQLFEEESQPFCSLDIAGIQRRVGYGLGGEESGRPNQRALELDWETLYVFCVCTFQVARRGTHSNPMAARIFLPLFVK